MNKSTRKAQMKAYLCKALREYHASTGISQEMLAEKLDITPRTCSALENGKSGFSTFSAFMLFSMLHAQKQVLLLAQLCERVTRPAQEAA